MESPETGTILDEIVAQKLYRLALQKEALPLQDVIEKARSAAPSRDFVSAISRRGSLGLIAEIKKASPSKGLLRETFEPADLALKYQNAGASAISVITERDFFMGSPEYLSAARNAVSLPVLRKDFIVDPYHVHESRMLGADALLLIVSILSDAQLSDFMKIAGEYGMTSLVEVHNEEELNRAVNCGAPVIGINNRNLKTMQVDLSTTEKLISNIPQGTTIVAESGIHSRDDMKRIASAGAHAVLVGEAIVTEEDVEGKIRSLLGEKS